MSFGPVETIEEFFVYKRWFNDKGLLHRLDGPALIKNLGDEVLLELWYINGKIYREDGPASISIEQNGNIKEIWYKNNIFHREDGPAFIIKDNKGNILDEQWYYNGIYHREDGPAILLKSEINISEIWCKHGIYHRIGGPAYIVRSKEGVVLREEWYNNCNLINLNGPAIVKRDRKGNIKEKIYSIYRYYSEDKFIKITYLIKKFIKKLKNRYRQSLTLMLKDLDYFEESNLCGEVTKYMI